jgi:hypothetical protein
VDCGNGVKLVGLVATADTIKAAIASLRARSGRYPAAHDKGVQLWNATVGLHELYNAFSQVLVHPMLSEGAATFAYAVGVCAAAVAWTQRWGWRMHARSPARTPQPISLTPCLPPTCPCLSC